MLKSYYGPSEEKTALKLSDIIFSMGKIYFITKFCGRICFLLRYEPGHNFIEQEL